MEAVDLMDTISHVVLKRSIEVPEFMVVVGRLQA